jgi:hypothetical protein
MTLSEAVAHVAKRYRGDRRSALKQLRDALGDRRIHSKWEDYKTPPIEYEGLSAGYWPPVDARFWLQQARIRGYKVFDRVCKCWRTLLLLRQDVRKIWPELPPAPPPPPAASRALVGRTRRLRDKIKALLLDHNVDLTMPVKTISKYVRDHWNEGKHPSDRTIVRAIKAAKEATTQASGGGPGPRAGRSRN